jgi:hypothetical protein
MGLTAATVAEKARAYPDVQPLSTVEEEHIEILPDMFERGEYGWRNPEWVVQWYGRRFLGAMPNAERRELEDAYDENDYEGVHAAISAAVETDDAAGMLSVLTDLAGVGVEVGSAFCQFIDPERYVVVDERQWSTLRELGEFDDIDDLDVPYPAPPAVSDYERYIERYRTIAARCGCDLWDLYRALWVIASEGDP